MVKISALKTQIFQIFVPPDPSFFKENPLPRPYFWKPVWHTPTKKKVECPPPPGAVGLECNSSMLILIYSRDEQIIVWLRPVSLVVMSDTLYHNIFNHLSTLLILPVILTPWSVDITKNLCETLNKHAPEKERTVVLRPHAPWYTESLRLAKQERGRRERKWIKSGLTVDKDLYKEQCGEYKQLLIKSKTEYHSNEVADANQRDLFRVIDKLTSPKASRTLLDHESHKDLANSLLHSSTRKSRSSKINWLPRPCHQFLSKKARHALLPLVNLLRSPKMMF